MKKPSEHLKRLKYEPKGYLAAFVFLTLLLNFRHQYMSSAKHL